MKPSRIITRRPVASCVAMTAVALAAAAAVPVAAAAAQAPAATGATPDFGPNVKIFYPSTPVKHINAYLKSISKEGQFSASRHA